MWGDGAALRDYLYIDDAVAACVHLVDSAKAIGPFNAGNGLGTSIAELIALVGRVTGRELEVVQRPARGTDVRAIVLDSTRLQHATGWTPRTGLEEGLRRTWSWIQETGT